MKIAISEYALDGKIPAGDSFWPKFNASFQNVDVPVVDVAYEIFTGHALTTWHRNKWRHTDNYILGQHIGLDFDTGDDRSTIATLADNQFIQRHAMMIHTTPSHTDDAPRARVIFKLTEPIHQPTNYARAARAMVWLFDGADSKCKDAARFFYGSAACDYRLMHGELSIGMVRNLIGEYERHGERTRKKYETADHEHNGDMSGALKWAIDNGAHGSRNANGFWLASKCRDDGLSVADAEQIMRQYQSAVTNASSPYTEREAAATVRSAYRKA
jgi:hypothetical protein